MKKEFTEEEIYQIDKDFKDLAQKQYEDSRRFFFKLLMAVLALIAFGAFLGVVFSK